MAMIYKYKILFIVMLLCQLGCANYTLVYHQKDFKLQSLDNITILPLVDARRVVEQKISFEEEIEEIQELIVKKLKKKGYVCKAIIDTNFVENIQPAGIPFLDAKSIRNIGPIDAKYILLPVVVELVTAENAYLTRSKGRPVVVVRAEMVCYLFEKPTGKLVWEGNAIFNKDLHGAIKKLMKEFPSKK